MSGFPDRSGKRSESENIQVLKFAKIHNRKTFERHLSHFGKTHFTFHTLCHLLQWRITCSHGVMDLISVDPPKVSPQPWDKCLEKVLHYEICRNPEIQYSTVQYVFWLVERMAEKRKDGERQCLMWMCWVRALLWIWSDILPLSPHITVWALLHTLPRPKSTGISSCI